METWFTSDTHFGHDKDFLFGPRGFDNWLEHGEAIVDNWNTLVAPTDVIYHLGDMMLTASNEDQSIEWISSLRGKIKWIGGNHDTKRRIEKVLEANKNIEFIGYADLIKIEKNKFFLSHYPSITSNFDDYKKDLTYNLFGHTHQKEKFYGENSNMFHVGLDSNGLKPVNIENIIEELKNARQ